MKQAEYKTRYTSETNWRITHFSDEGDQCLFFGLYLERRGNLFFVGKNEKCYRVNAEDLAAHVYNYYFLNKTEGSKASKILRESGQIEFAKILQTLKINYTAIREMCVYGFWGNLSTQNH